MELFRQRFDLLLLLVGEQQEEFVSRIAGNEARTADRVAQVAGDAAFWLRVVTHHVVNVLEVVEVEEHNGHRRFFGQLRSHPLLEQFAVRQFGKRVVVGDMLQLAERLVKL